MGEQTPRIFLVRDRVTGLYWRGSKKKYGKEVRSPWTDDPAKAWHSWQDEKQIHHQFEGHFWRGGVPEYDIVEFEMRFVGSIKEKDDA
jgi:hypothetical protein